nr:diguanylate cyclase [Pseudoalteromonas tetraodonis]
MHNRHSFDRRCKALINKLAPSQYLGLAMIDVDYFKNYNDNYGHLEGDNVLVAVANRLNIVMLILWCVLAVKISYW